MSADPPAVAWTEAARARLGLDPEPGQRPPRLAGLLADLTDLARSWRGYPVERGARREQADQLRALRRRVALADAETLAAARDRAAELRAPAEIALRCAFSFLFPREGAWSRADAAACLQHGAPPPCADLLLASLDDADLVEKILGARVALGALEDPGLRALEIIHALGPRAVPALAIMLAWLDKAERRKSDRRAVLDAMALVQTPEAAAILAARLAEADVKALAGRYFRGAPALALRALPPIASGRRKIAEVARALLAAAVAGHPELADHALPELGAPARRAVAAARDKAEVRLFEAAPEEVPRLLLRPPWRHKSERPIPIVEDLRVVEITAPAADRDAWATRLHWVPNALVFSSRVALAIAHALLHRPEDRDAALAWLHAFPEIAAAGLLPAALREPSAARLDAGRALRLLAARDAAAVDRAIARYSADARAAARVVLAQDPIHDCPFDPPRLPDFLHLDALPRPVLAGGDRALPREATRSVVEMLAFSPPDEPYAGLAVVKQACAPASLDALAWSIFEAWLAAGAPARAAWAEDALALIGGDESARKLAAKIKGFMAERGAAARAVEAASVLARIGTDVALMHLASLAERSRSAAVEQRARAALAAAARARGLDADDLGDRIVPDLDLDPDGSKVLSYGARSFRVGFDERLAPFVRDGEGAILRSLPRPSRGDDEQAARAAMEAWAALKDNVGAIARGQILRLEQSPSS